MDWQRLFKGTRGGFRQNETSAAKDSTSLSEDHEDSTPISKIVHQLSQGDRDSQKQAVDGIIGLGDNAYRAVPQLIPLFRHPDQDVRRSAVLIVGRIGPQGNAAKAELIKSLADPDSSVRRSARIAIVQVDPEAHALFDALSYPDERIRMSALETFPRLAKLSPPPVNTLVAHLGDEDGHIRQAIIRTLVSIGAEAVPTLVGALSDDLNRSLAIEGLAQMKEAAVPAIPQLLDLASGNDVELAVEVIGALSKIGPSAVRGLAGLLSHSSQTVRARAVTALGEMGPSARASIPELIAGLAYPDIRQQVVKTLGALGAEAKDAIPALVNLLDDKRIDSEFFKHSAAEDLYTELCGELSPHDTVSSEICYALAQMGSVSELRSALKHSREHVRECAARAIASMRTNATALSPDLISVLTDPSERVRRAAASALCTIVPDREARVDAVLTTIAETRSNSVADDHLQLVLGTNDVPALLKRLSSESPVTRWAADRALRAILPALTVVPIPDPMGGPDYIVDYNTLDPDELSRLLHARPDVFELLSHVHSPDHTCNLTGPSRRGEEHLPELVKKVRQHQMLLFEAEAELAKTAVKSERPVIEVDKTATKAQATTAAVGSGAALAPIDAEAPPRYADYTFYKEDKSGNRLERLLPQMPLKMGFSYKLEVAVRLGPTGITSLEERKPIREPRQSERVEVIVAAESEYFLIPQPVQRLVLPPTGDSVENAWFCCVKPRLESHPGKRFPIHIRLYYKCNLLEVATIEAEVVGPLDPDCSSRTGVAYPISLTQERLEQRYEHFDLVLPRAMHIDVSRSENGGIQFTFILNRGEKHEIAFAGSSQIEDHELESTLLGIRRALLETTLWDDFGTQIECKDQTRFDKAMNKLAQLGSTLWNEIFCYDTNSSLFLIGDWLRSNPLPVLSKVQVSVAADASTFVFPWNILYDKDVPHDESERPDLQGFWGLRYVVEQRIPGAQCRTDEPLFVQGKLELGYLLSRFNEAVTQQNFLNDLVQQSLGRMSQINPIDTREAAYQYLQNCPSHIVYFFAHGHTQFPNANNYGFSSENFVKLYDSLPSTSPIRVYWADTYDEVKNERYDSDTSWIKLANGKLILNNLYGPHKLQLHEHPFVFLNMCESAQITPTAGQSFVHLFMNRGACGVLGTECSMRPFIAHQFATQFFEALLSGSSVGEVLLDLRQKFIEKGNPLGLAYTLYGAATTRFEPPPLAANFSTSRPETQHEPAIT